MPKSFIAIEIEHVSQLTPTTYQKKKKKGLELRSICTSSHLAVSYPAQCVNVYCVVSAKRAHRHLE